MNKKQLLIASAAIISAGVYSTSVMGAGTTGTATATVVEAITINKTANLVFGEIVLAAGDVTIAPGGGLSGSLTPITATNPGSFDVNGEDGRTYAITLDATATITDPVSSNTIAITGIDHKYGAGNPGTIPVTVADVLTVGGTLTLIGTETPGAYAGNFDISVDYN